METIRKFIRPVIDLPATGAQIKKIRKSRGFSVHDLQIFFGFDYPQAIYGWESGKCIPTVDNLLILSKLFHVEIGQLLVTRNVEISLPEEALSSLGKSEIKVDYKKNTNFIKSA